MERPFVFGHRLAPAESARPAAWLDGVVDISTWTVGGLLPAHYESYLLIESAPVAMDENWWTAQRQIITALAEVLAAFTATPDRAWFAIWEGSSSRWSKVGALRRVPRVELPWRTYFLITGEVADVAHIVEPTEPHDWFRPDLWWPEDRQWFVGTDIDFWCTYVGGSNAMTDAIVARLPGLCRPASLDEVLRQED